LPDTTLDMPPRESMDFDVVIVGAGPAGLATAIRLKQLAAERGNEITVVVLEKGSEVGAHILSGAVFDPAGLTALIPDWKDAATAEAAISRPIIYPKADGVLTFDRLTNVAFSATNHEEDQPAHLKLADPSMPVRVNLPKFAEPAQRYCPVGP
jgi:2-polyprenyl-6-methoxyphenol hydroxylase-like FAD-dependent oxidoreductase